MSKHQCLDCDAWVLSGGEGRRMGGQDKGLIQWGEYPMAWQVAKNLSNQVFQVRVNANRNLQTYQTWPWPVLMDDADLPTRGGPMVGLLTGLRHSQAPWLQLAACDTPMLPTDLVSKLLAAAMETQSQLVVPVTRHRGSALLYNHWTTALVARQCMVDLEQAVKCGERRMGQWMTRQRWSAVLFDETETQGAFTNMNTPNDLVKGAGTNEP